MIQTFRLLSPVMGLYVKSYPIADVDLINFNSSTYLEMGEWLTINSSGQADRCANPGTHPGPFVLFAEKGRSDIQGIGGRGKVPLIILGTYIAETKIFEGTLALGAELEAGDVSVDLGDGAGAKTRSGLQALTTGKKIGHVLKTSASNNGWLRFIYTAS